VSRYQKGKTNLDFTEERDSEWQWHQLGRVQVCTSLQTDNHASTPPLSFLQAGWPYCSLQCFDAVGWVAGRASGRKKTEWWVSGVVICLERSADLHMAQLMPLPLTVSCFSKIQIGFHLSGTGSPG